eukprot:scaffold290533_cov21-Tisochrysis_lutea.AAC.1
MRLESRQEAQAAYAHEPRALPSPPASRLSAVAPKVSSARESALSPECLAHGAARRELVVAGAAATS